MSNYDAPYSVETFNAAPRFGHSRDLVRVLTNQEGWSDYAQGCMFIGAFILTVFVVWVVLTGLFFCCGPRTVGILSGRRLRDDRKTIKHCFYRSLLLCSCVLSLMSGITFLVKVSSSLEDTFDSVRNGIGGVAGVGRNVTSVADKIIEAGTETVPIRDATVSILNEGVCSAFEGGNGVTINFDEQALAATQILTDLADFSQGELTDLRNNFENEFNKAETEINLVVDQAQGYAKVSYYAIAIIVFTFLLSLGGHFSWHGPRVRLYFFLQSWVILPLYFLVLIFTVTVVATLAAVLTVNSDVCLPNPESLIKGIVDTRDLDGYPQQVVDFYIINSCRGEFEGLTMVETLINDLKDGRQSVIDLDLVLEKEQSDFEAMCGGVQGSLDGLKSSLSAIQLAFSSLLLAAEDVSNLLQCQPINAMYEDFFHGGVCRALPDTLFWMFVTMTLVVALGMVIFSLRGALVPSQKSNEPEDYFYTTSERRNEYHDDEVEESALRQDVPQSKTTQKEDPRDDV